jgi:hypothetical protein
MEHVLKNPTSHVGRAYVNAKGNTECVEFVRQAMGAPHTSKWVKGRDVHGDMSIPTGTAIATFVNGQYPQTGTSGMHAAIYVSQDAKCIWVTDQWRAQGAVRTRPISFDTKDTRLSNQGKAFSVIEW